MSSSTSSNSSSNNNNSYNTPCAACKFLRRKCLPGCTFAPYFPPEDPQKFIHVHKVFGASNVAKLLHDLHPRLREDAVHSLAYEAAARVRDPVYGCVATISYLQSQVQKLHKELDAANADLIRYTCNSTEVDGHDRAPTAQGIQASTLPPQRVQRYIGDGGSNSGDGDDDGGDGWDNWVLQPYYLS